VWGGVGLFGCEDLRILECFLGVLRVFLCGLLDVFGVCGAGSRLLEVANFRVSPY
jgi:hypothetical protein